MASLKYIAKQERLAREKEAQIQSALDHYARTEVPFDRIASHTDLSLDDVRSEMASRVKPLTTCQWMIRRQEILRSAFPFPTTPAPDVWPMPGHRTVAEWAPCSDLGDDSATSGQRSPRAL